MKFLDSYYPIKLSDSWYDLSPYGQSRPRLTHLLSRPGRPRQNLRQLKFAGRGHMHPHKSKSDHQCYVATSCGSETTRQTKGAAWGKHEKHTVFPTRISQVLKHHHRAWLDGYRPQWPARRSYRSSKRVSVHFTGPVSDWIRLSECIAASRSTGGVVLL